MLQSLADDIAKANQPVIGTIVKRIEPTRPIRLAALVGFMAMLAPVAAQAQSQTGETAPRYVGSETCTACHTQEAAAWEGSHHALAWTVPTAQTVLGDFDNTTFDHKGITTTFRTEGDDFTVETQGADGTLQRFPVVGVAGIAPLQQYLLDTGKGRQQSLDVSWDVEGERWYHLYPDQDLPAGNGLHWTGPYKNWNARCAECHATGYEKNYDPVSESYASTEAEIGVGCEACHGPGEAHLAWTEENTLPDGWEWASLTDYGFTIDFGDGLAETQIQQCAGCHSRRETLLDGSPLPGTPFHDAYRLSIPRPGLYHADGQILDEVYVYGSFLQSKMYANGVRCSDCHDVHTAQVKAQDNSLCTQCHSPAGNPRFPTLPLAEYDTPAHHFHTPDTDGAQCKSCHMIERDYMGIDGRRDHSFRVPRPDLTETLGTPNACSDCHADKPASWAAAVLKERFPNSTHRSADFAIPMSAAFNGYDRSKELVSVAMDLANSGIIRASALTLLANGQAPQIAEAVQAALNDPDPLVRVAAVQAQRSAAPQELAQRIIPLLDDPTRAVRIAVAREMLGLPILRIPDAYQTKVNRGMAEWQASLLSKADFPETQMVLGGIGLTTRNLDSALAAFNEAVKQDPQMVQAWSMIIRLQDAMGNREAAIDALKEAEKSNLANPVLLQLKSQMQ